MLHRPISACSIRLGGTGETDPARAAKALARQIGQDAMGLAVFFASSRYDLDALGAALAREFGPVPLIGCTTAGEIGLEGYSEGGMSGFSFGADDITAEIGLLDNVTQLQPRQGQSFAFDLRRRLLLRHAQLCPEHSFAVMLVDGLCMHEENIARALYDGLGGLPMVGGSAGDDLRFQRTAVYHQGRFHHDAAVLLAAATPYHTTSFKTQHFVCGARRLVVTAADPSRRLVTEINGSPAAEEYARVVGLDPTQLSPMVFSAHPMAVKVGGADFVRSVQKVNDDGSMTFYCAIDEGIVFNIAEGVDMVANLRSLFERIEDQIGRPRLIIGCDCILRKLEMSQKGLTPEVAEIMASRNVVGFSTYGEQFRGMHVNQTFTGIAFGAREAG
jgi:hypothetical protein